MSNFDECFWLTHADQSNQDDLYDQTDKGDWNKCDQIIKIRKAIKWKNIMIVVKWFKLTKWLKMITRSKDSRCLK